MGYNYSRRRGAGGLTSFFETARIGKASGYFDTEEAACDQAYKAYDALSDASRISSYTNETNTSEIVRDIIKDEVDEQAFKTMCTIYLANQKTQAIQQEYARREIFGTDPYFPESNPNIPKIPTPEPYTRPPEGFTTPSSTLPTTGTTLPPPPPVAPAVGTGIVITAEIAIIAGILLL